MYKTIVILICIAFVSALGVRVYTDMNRPPVTEVYIFSLTKGHAIFIRTHSDRRYLIDGGSNSEIIRHITKVLPFYSKRIDGVFVTGVDSRDVGGLIHVLKRYDVGSIYMPSINVYGIGLASTTNDAYLVLMDEINVREIAGFNHIKRLSAGDDLEIDDGVLIRTLFPVMGGDSTREDSTKESFSYSKSSPPMLVLQMLTDAGHSIVFLGDSTSKIQKVLKNSVNYNSAHSSARISVPRSSIAVTSNNISESNLVKDFLQNFGVTHLVFSGRDSNKFGTTNSVAPKIAHILNANRYNVRDGTVRIKIERATFGGSLSFDQL